jgi:hypothetical protein
MELKLNSKVPRTVTSFSFVLNKTATFFLSQYVETDFKNFWLDSGFKNFCPKYRYLSMYYRIFFLQLYVFFPGYSVSDDRRNCPAHSHPDCSHSGTEKTSLLTDNHLWPDVPYLLDSFPKIFLFSIIQFQIEKFTIHQ